VGRVLFNVSQLLREQIGAERVYPLDGPIPAVTEDGPASHVEGTARLVRTHRGLLAYAQLNALARDTCSRCLGTAEIPLQVSVEEEFLPTVDVLTGAPLPRPEDDSVFLVDEHHHLDLTEAIRQALVIAQPMQPLCRPECAGLCERCGTDRNTGPCACPPDAPDARWSALGALLDQPADVDAPSTTPIDITTRRRPRA
jgi:uncharacterized protein